MSLVGTGKMAVQGVDPHTCQWRDLLRSQTKPVHPGVDHDIAEAVWRVLAPARDLIDGVEDRPRAARQGGREIVRPYPVENRYGRRRKEVAKLLCFPPRRNEEVTTAGLRKDSHNVPRT